MLTVRELREWDRPERAWAFTRDELVDLWPVTGEHTGAVYKNHGGTCVETTAPEALTLFALGESLLDSLAQLEEVQQ